MTGTDSSFTDLVNNTSCKSRNIHLLSTWLFGKINTDCILIDITTCGGSSLIPQNLSTPSGLFDLVIMSPDKPHEAIISIQAEIRWADNTFSEKHNKIGFKFHNAQQSDLLSIESLAEHFMHDKKSDDKCSIINN